MVILLYGEDTFRLKRKLNEIIEKHKARHESGLNLARFEEKDLVFEKIRQVIETISMFDEKKLIILENVFENKVFQENFLNYVKQNKLKNNQDVIVVLHQRGKLAISSFKCQLSMFEEFKFLQGSQLSNWVKKEIIKRKAEIVPEALGKLVAYVGHDLWQISNEIDKLITYKAQKLIKEEDVDLLIKSKIDTNIFKTLDALANRDKKTALRFLHEHMESGENEFYLFSMLAYQIRTLLKLKDLMERNVPYYDLAKKSGLPLCSEKKPVAIKRF